MKSDEQPYIYVNDYGDMLAQVNDMELVDFRESGDYQGVYYAVLKAEAEDIDYEVKTPERLFYYFGSYGSCSGCDWLESEAEWNMDDKESNKRYKIEYKEALKYAQQSRPVFIVPATSPLKLELDDGDYWKVTEEDK